MAKWSFVKALPTGKQRHEVSPVSWLVNILPRHWVLFCKCAEIHKIHRTRSSRSQEAESCPGLVYVPTQWTLTTVAIVRSYDVWMTHFSSSPFTIHLSLPQSYPSFFLSGFLKPQCFSILVNYYFKVSLMFFSLLFKFNGHLVHLHRLEITLNGIFTQTSNVIQIARNHLFPYFCN